MKASKIQSDVEALGARQAELAAQISTQSEAHEAAVGDLAELFARSNREPAEVEAVRNRIRGAADELSALRAGLALVEGEIAQLTTRLKGMRVTEARDEVAASRTAQQQGLDRLEQELHASTERILAIVKDIHSAEAKALEAERRALTLEGKPRMSGDLPVVDVRWYQRPGLRETIEALRIYSLGKSDGQVRARMKELMRTPLSLNQQPQDAA